MHAARVRETKRKAKGFAESLITSTDYFPGKQKKGKRECHRPEDIPTAVDPVDRVRETVFGESTAIDRTNGGFSIGGFFSCFYLEDESLLRRHLSALSFSLSA